MLQINKKYLDFFNSFKTCGLLAGGRNTGKSFFGATLCLLNAKEGTCNSFAMRKFYQDAERDTASLLIAVAKLLFGEEEFSELWQYKVSYNQLIYKPSGNYIICRGVGRNVESLKSFGDIQFLWIDEATNFSSDEITTIIPSIQDRWKNGKLLLTSNIPPNKRHWIYRMFLSDTRENKDFKGLLSSYKDNPFIDQERVEANLKALFIKGSNRYIREVEGRVPDFANEFVINNFETLDTSSLKFKKLYFLITLIAGDMYCLCVARDYNNIYILGEKSIEGTESFVDKLYEFVINMEHSHLKKINNGSSLYIKKNSYKLLYNLVLKNLKGIKSFSVVDEFSLKELVVLNFKPLKLLINNSCWQVINEIDLAEWDILEDGELNEYKKETMEAQVKLFYLNALKLLKPILKMSS